MCIYWLKCPFIIMLLQSRNAVCVCSIEKYSSSIVKFKQYCKLNLNCFVCVSVCVRVNNYYFCDCCCCCCFFRSIQEQLFSSWKPLQTVLINLLPNITDANYDLVII